MKSNVTFNPVLAATFRKFLTAAEGLVGRVIAPIFNTGEQSANYYVFDAANTLNTPRLKPRAPGDTFSRSAMVLSGDFYNCKHYGHETPVPDEFRKKYASAFDADRAAIERNAQIIMINHELRVKELVDGAAITSSTPAIKWDAYTTAGGDPVGDIATAKEVVRTQCGIRPNTLVVSETVYQKLRFHPAIRKTFYGNTDGVVTKEMLRAIFEVDTFAVAGAVQNMAAEGQAISPADIWGDNALLCVSASVPALDAPSAFRTFVWNGGGDAGTTVETYREDARDCDIHRSKHHTDEKLTGAEMAYRFTDVLA
jgi:hypothetical protein